MYEKLDLTLLSADKSRTSFFLPTKFQSWNFNPMAEDLRLGFRISPDITIALVRPKPEPPPTTHLTSESPTNNDEEYEDEEYESENEFDPDFNPLVFCTTTMDDDEKKDEMSSSHESRTNPHHYPTLLAALCKQSKKSSVRNTHSNENSSLVCNGGKSQAGVISKPKKRFTCHICLKTFGWTTDLKRHILIHTGERPFKCSLCLATFTRNFLLQKHKTKVHQCLSPNEASQLNNNVAKNVMEIKLKMRELEEAKSSNMIESTE